MNKKRLRIMLFSVSIGLLACLPAAAQGGWRQWDIHLFDGSMVQANPLGLRDGRFTRSMSKDEKGIERTEISHISAVTRSLPPAPTGKSKRDLIILLDGTRSLGSVAFKEIKFSEGTIVQNGKDMPLENVAYIIFARRKKKLRN